MQNTHMKRYSTSAIIRDTQVKTLMRYYFTPVRIAIIKSRQRDKQVTKNTPKIAGFIKDVEKLESQCFAYSNVESCSHCEELCDVPKINTKLSFDLAIPFLVIYFKRIESKDLTYISTSMLTAVFWSKSENDAHVH